MIKDLTYFSILFLAVGVAAPACADDVLKDYDGKRIGKTFTRTETKSHYDYTGRPFTPNAVKIGREIVIDKQGRRIGFAIPTFYGETNNDLLRLRSGKRYGNQIVGPTGRRVGIIIRK